MIIDLKRTLFPYAHALVKMNDRQILIEGVAYKGAETALAEMTFTVNNAAFQLAGKIPEVMVSSCGDAPCFTEDMVGHKLGEFAPTRTFKGHAGDKATARK